VDLDLSLDLSKAKPLPPRKSSAPQEQEKPKERAKLTESELSILAFVEQVFWETGYVPTKERVIEGLDPLKQTRTRTKVNKAWDNPRFQSALEMRGLEFKNDGKLLSPTQLLLVNMLLNVEDKKSLRQKLDMIGVKMTQYQSWLRDPAFNRYLVMRTEQMFEHSDHEAYKALIQSVMRGDVAALKLFFEMRGIWSPRLDININIETVVYRLVEIVGKHVKNPEILQAIANEVESLELPAHA